MIASLKNWLQTWWDYIISTLKQERWLSQVVRKDLKQHRTFQERLGFGWETLKYEIKNNASWRYVVPCLLILFILCLWSFMPVIVIVGREEALDILEKRLTNFITVFGTSITVAVFIVNIIKGRQNGEGYNTVLVEAGFYPVLYSSLGTIGILSLISTYRNIFGKSGFIWLSDDVMIRMVFLGAWLFALLLVTIGWLFLRLYRFLNTNELRLRRIDRMRYLAYKEMLGEIRQRRSLDIYRKFVQSLGFRESYWGNVYNIKTKITLGDAPKKWKPFSRHKPLHILKDINLAGLKRIHGQQIRHLYLPNSKTYQALYEGLSLGRKVLQEETQLFTFIHYPPKGIDYLTQQPTVNQHVISQTTVQSLAKQFITATQDHITEYEMEIQFLHDDVIKAANEGSLVAFKPMLEIYQAIYSIAGELYKYYDAGNRKKYPTPFDFWDKWSVLSDCFTAIDSAMETAQKKNHLDVFDALHYHIASVLVEAAKNSFWVFFHDYAERFRRSYIYLKEFTVKQESSLAQSPDIIQNMGLIIRRHVIDVFDAKFSRILDASIEVKAQFTTCYHAIYTHFSYLLRETIQRNDAKSFHALLKSFQEPHRIQSEYINNLKTKIDRTKNLLPHTDNTQKEIDDLENHYEVSLKPYTYKGYATFAIFTWIFFQFYKKTITFHELREFIPEDFFHFKDSGFDEYFYSRFFNTNYFNTATYLNEILPFIEEADTLLNLKQWTWTENYSASYWLWVGVVLGLMNQHDIENPQIKGIEDFQVLLAAPQNIEGICKDIIQRSDDWAQVFVRYDKTEIERRCNLVVRLFSTLKEHLEKKVEQKIIEAPINDQIVKDIQNDIYKSYNKDNFEQSSIRFWAKGLKAEEVRDIQNSKNLHILYSGEIVEGMKKLFVDPKLSPYALSNLRNSFVEMPGDYSRYINDKFMDVVLSATSPVMVNDPAQGIIDAIESLKNKGFTPNLVLCSGPLFLWNHPSFSQDLKQRISRVYYYYENNDPKIPVATVLTTQQSQWNNKIVVCDFAKAFRLCEHRSDEWYGKHINIQVREVTENQAHIEAEKRGLTPNTEEFKHKVHALRLGMNLMIEEYIDFEVLNINAFEILDVVRN